LNAYDFDKPKAALLVSNPVPGGHIPNAGAQIYEALDSYTDVDTGQSRARLRAQGNRI
jgi:uncharacterized protein involved in type VI secretion and phage assembly